MGEVVVDGRAVGYDIAGSGAPTIVLIAGGGGDRSHFSSVFGALSELTTTVAYDRGGLGVSAPHPGGADGLRWRVAELRGLVEAIGAPKPLLLVGHSLGALIAQLYAVEFPDEVAGVVSIDGDDGIPTELPEWPEFPPEVELEAMQRLFANVPPSARPQMPPSPERMAVMYAETSDREAAFARLASADRSRTRFRFVHLGATGHFFGPAELIPVPVETIIQKLLDKNHRTAAAYPNGLFVEAPNSGHYIQFDEPDLVIGTIRGLLADLST
jgi:pimeloyl-ACP methyl ester carboxylesterase